MSRDMGTDRAGPGELAGRGVGGARYDHYYKGKGDSVHAEGVCPPDIPDDAPGFYGYDSSGYAAEEQPEWGSAVIAGCDEAPDSSSATKTDIEALAAHHKPPAGDGGEPSESGEHTGTLMQGKNPADEVVVVLGDLPDEPCTRDPRLMREGHQQEAPPSEKKRAASHNAQDAVLEESLANNGIIPEDIDISPGDRAVVECAAEIIRDNLTRLLPGAVDDRSDVVRHMASDADLDASARAGMTISALFGIQRALELTVEDPRARTAREVAHKTLSSIDGGCPTGQTDIETVASEFAAKVQPHAFDSSQQGAQIAPYLAAHLVEVTGSRYHGFPEIIAAAVLGFEHSCDIAQVTLRQIPEDYQRLRAETRDALRAAAAEVDREVNALPGRGISAEQIAEHADASMRRHVVANCAALGADYAHQKDTERHRAIEAAAAKAELEERLLSERRERKAQIVTLNRRDRQMYHRTIADPPEVLAASIQQDLSSQDMPGLLRHAAALIEHVEAGTPGAHQSLDVVWPHIEAQVVDYVGSQRDQLANGRFSSGLIKVLDCLAPTIADDAVRVDKLGPTLEALDALAAAYYHPERKSTVRVMRQTPDGKRAVTVHTSATYRPRDIAVARMAFVRHVMNTGVDPTITQLVNAGDGMSATLIVSVRDARDALLAEEASYIDVDGNLPESLRRDIAEARRGFARQYSDSASGSDSGVQATIDKGKGAAARIALRLMRSTRATLRARRRFRC